MEAHLIFLILHIVGFAIGVGAATASDPLFVGSLRNRRLSSDQLVLLRTLSWVVLGGLALAVLSGVALVWMAPPRIQEPGFLAKMTIVFVIAADGALFHLKVLPQLEHCVDERISEDFLADRLPLLAATGATSSVSWYSALLLGVLLRFEMPYLPVINIYLILVVGAAISAYLVLGHIIFTPQPEPEEIVAEHRFEKAFGWVPVVLAAVVFCVIAVGVAELVTTEVLFAAVEP